MIKVGITGQAGFVGTTLYNTLNLQNSVFQTIPFYDEYFGDNLKLQAFVKECDVIVHLAAQHRNNTPEAIYQTNITLVKQVIEACQSTKSKPHIIFSSSIQEERDNLFGKSKKDGRQMFEKWAKENSANFTGLLIPNVYGPFGKPYYNSVVATFCHQLTHNETPKIDVDGELKLIYLGELVEEIINSIKTSEYKEATDKIEFKRIGHTCVIKVSELLNKLESFKTQYFEQGIIPDLKSSFELNLFNTFTCYIDHTEFYPFHLKKNSDDRGHLVETVKAHSGGQIFFSNTKPQITRGNHFHTRKAERFAVIKGKARIDVRRIGTDKIMSFEIDGNNPAFVDMPIWHTHNITNIGEDDLYTIFWVNEHFDPTNADTYFEKV